MAVLLGFTDAIVSFRTETIRPSAVLGLTEHLKSIMTSEIDNELILTADSLNRLAH